MSWIRIRIVILTGADPGYAHTACRTETLTIGTGTSYSSNENRKQLVAIRSKIISKLLGFILITGSF